MGHLKKLTYFRIHPFLGIITILVVTIFAVAAFLYSTPSAYGIPFGGSVTSYTPICVLDSVCTPNCTQCTISCNMGCGVFPIICGTLSEVVVDGQTYCPMQQYPYLGGGTPSVGGFILGLGIPLVPFGIFPPTGTN